jgi:hypothetical protein
MREVRGEHNPYNERNISTLENASVAPTSNAMLQILDGTKRKKEQNEHHLRESLLLLNPKEGRGWRS